MDSPDIIKDTAETLKEISESGITIIQGWYNKDLQATHITLWDLGETDVDYSDDVAEGIMLSIQVTIFSKKDEIGLARKIKKLMLDNDFNFEERNADDSQPKDGIYMKAQRFSKLYESEE